VTGPLAGLRVVEIGGLGPAPFCAMVLADLGADVLRIERPDKAPLIPPDAPPDAAAPGAAAPAGPSFDFLSRGRPCAAIDLKHPEGAALVRRLTGGADAFVEGFRPGVAERLGIGPDDLRAANPRLVYGRMTGWGRSGPLADQPGHDLNYLSIAGVLGHIGRVGQPPTPPLNLVADFGGGGLLLALGICAAIVERATSGEGQVVDAAMIDGSALLMAPIFGAAATGFWSDRRGTNLLDSGAPFYDCYECADGGYVAVAAIEPQFYAALLDGLDLAGAGLPDQHDQTGWPALRERFDATFRTRTRDEWAEHFAARGACVTPVLTMSEAMEHPQPTAWGTFVDVGGARQPGPAPRFSRTPGHVSRPPSPPGADTTEALTAWGIPADEIARLAAAGVVAGA
jgi:alpha-methylacyl-CoA racemase